MDYDSHISGNDYDGEDMIDLTEHAKEIMFDKNKLEQITKERDELRAKLDRIESIATVGKEHSLLFGKPFAAIGFEKILKECE